MMNGSVSERENGKRWRELKVSERRSGNLYSYYGALERADFYGGKVNFRRPTTSEARPCLLRLRVLVLKSSFR